MKLMHKILYFFGFEQALTQIIQLVKMHYRHWCDNDCS